MPRLDKLSYSTFICHLFNITLFKILYNIYIIVFLRFSVSFVHEFKTPLLLLLLKMIQDLTPG